MSRNTVLRLLPLLPMTLLFGSLVGDPAFGYAVLLVGWILSTVALGSLLLSCSAKAAPDAAIRAAETCRNTRANKLP